MSLFALVFVTAIGFSIRIVDFGTMKGRFCPFFSPPRASFSYESRTSPLPARNVFTESRALLSWATTFLKSLRRLACACLSVLPCFLQAP